jgi:hypothetical protein
MPSVILTGSILWPSCQTVLLPRQPTLVKASITKQRRAQPTEVSPNTRLETRRRSSVDCESDREPVGQSNEGPLCAAEECQVKGKVRTSSLGCAAQEGSASRAGGAEDSERPAFLEFFGLREQPFDQTPNPRYFYPSATHKEALASLLTESQRLR